MDEGVYLTKEEATWLLHHLAELLEAMDGGVGMLRGEWFYETALFADVVAVRLRTKGGGGNPDLN